VLFFGHCRTITAAQSGSPSSIRECLSIRRLSNLRCHGTSTGTALGCMAEDQAGTPHAGKSTGGH
jgi:hypothetical protein